MYASIRKYKSYVASEVLEKVRETFVPMISSMPGFVEYHLVKTDNVFVSISIFETEELANESNVAAQRWVSENIPSLIEGELEFSSGELVITEHTG